MSARQQPGQRVSQARGERRRGALAQQPEPGQRPLTVPGHRIRQHRQRAQLDQVQTAEASGRYNAWIVAAYDPVQECGQVLSIAKLVPVLMLNRACAMWPTSTVAFGGAGQPSPAGAVAAGARLHVPARCASARCRGPRRMSCGHESSVPPWWMLAGYARYGLTICPRNPGFVEGRLVRRVRGR